MTNPPDGWLMNTNNWPYSMAGKDSPRRDAYPKYMDTAGENPRGVHAVRVRDGRRDFTPQGLLDAAYELYLTAFARLIPTLAAAYDGAPGGDPLKARLAGQMALFKRWDLKWSARSEATSLAVFWGEALWARVAPAAKAAGRNVYDDLVAAPGPEKLAALAEASDRLAADFGDWRTPWGEINRFQRLTGDLVQPFDDKAPSIAVPFTSAQWGRWPRSARSAGRERSVTMARRGNSFVAVVEFGGKVHARAVSAGGESGDPRSSHFNDQAGRYAAGDLREVYSIRRM